jgi:hypothetical protein
LNPVLEISVENVLPEAGAILVQQGVPEQIGGGDELLALAKRARDELAATLAPIGVVAEVTKEEFAGIYCGQGLNDSRTPLELIFPLAEKMALFAVTCGQGVGDRIRELFNAHDYPLGAALDAAASLAADQAAQVAQDSFSAAQDKETGVLRYSPGYCGWHVSGQMALFAFLDPDAVGITLTESFLMHPLKSVSGVIVAGQPDIHRFVHDFSFCAACTGKECRERIGSLRVQPENGA